MSTAAKLTGSFQPHGTLLAKFEEFELLGDEVAEESWADVTVSDITLNGTKMDADVTSNVTGATLERTIEGASTLTLNIFDKQRVLLESRILAESSVITSINGNLFELVKVEKSGDMINLTFEDYVVSLLRLHSKFFKVSRSKITRAEFILRMIREVKAYKIKYFIPELHTKQPIGKPKTKAVRKSQKKKGLSGASGLKVKGAKATKSQLSQAERALGVADDLNVSTKVMIAMMCAAIGESNLGDEPGTFTSGNYRGVFQAPPSEFDPHDTERQAHYFLKGGKGFQQGGAIALSKKQPGLGPGDIATKVEASGQPGSFYGRYASEARALVKEFTDGGGSGTPEIKVKKYEFTRGQPHQKEDSWTCIRRLAEEVNWQAFVVNNKFYYMSEKKLYQQDPVAIINEDLDFVDWVDFDFDLGKKVNTATVQARAALWAAPPGSVVKLTKSGPANGRWLVASVSRSLFSLDVNITLRKPAPKKPEPAPETQTVSGGKGGSSSSSSGYGSPLKSMPSVSGKFGEDRGDHIHAGTDLPVPIGTPVYAVADGKVTHAGAEGGYGNSVVLKHSGSIGSRYGHLSRFKCHVGQTVRKGDLIAYSGNTGNSTGPHLHFEILKNGRQVCPANYVKSIPKSACLRQSL